VAAAGDEVMRLSRLVDALLALARADENAAPSEIVDLTELARARVEVWRPTLERDVRLRLDAVGPVLARAGNERLAQVLDNLIANALRAAPDGTTVTVEIRQTGAGPQAVVRDEGPGMTAAEKARAFDRFWRAGSGSDGSGLGLAIARRLAELDGGTIELRDAPGSGLEAVLGLPRA
jgi:signal transduction histidine kinase